MVWYNPGDWIVGLRDKTYLGRDVQDLLKSSEQAAEHQAMRRTHAEDLRSMRVDHAENLTRTHYEYAEKGLEGKLGAGLKLEEAKLAMKNEHTLARLRASHAETMKMANMGFLERQGYRYNKVKSGIAGGIEHVTGIGAAANRGKTALIIGGVVAGTALLAAKMGFFGKSKSGTDAAREEGAQEVAMDTSGVLTAEAAIPQPMVASSNPLLPAGVNPAPGKFADMVSRPSDSGKDVGLPA